MKIRNLLASMATLLLRACSGTRGPRITSTLPDVSSDATTDVIRELVLRDLMAQHSPTAGGARSATCFVSFEDRIDPSPSFLDRLAGACAVVAHSGQGDHLVR